MPGDLCCSTKVLADKHIGPNMLCASAETGIYGDSRSRPCIIRAMRVTPLCAPFSLSSHSRRKNVCTHMNILPLLWPVRMLFQGVQRQRETVSSWIECKAERQQYKCSGQRCLGCVSVQMVSGSKPRIHPKQSIYSLYADITRTLFEAMFFYLLGACSLCSPHLHRTPLAGYKTVV